MAWLVSRSGATSLASWLAASAGWSRRFPAREHQLRQAQDDLAHRERHYRALIENATDLVTILSPDGTIRYKSPSVQRILGYTSDELVGRRSLDFIHPDDQSMAQECDQAHWPITRKRPARPSTASATRTGPGALSRHSAPT